MENHKLECDKHPLGEEFMRASEFITEQVSAKYIFDLAKKVHRKLDDFSDGDLADRIYWFDQYTLTELPVSKINTHEFDVDEDLVAKHIAKIMKSTDTMPPIIYDPIAKSIIDGIHRVNAYKKLGYETIPAYVGSKKSQSYGQSDEIDEARLDEVPLPPDWDPEKLNLRQTYKDRLQYALDRAKRLGSGSSRVAMTIDYEGRPTVLKVAKNAKGLAQNEAEVEILLDGYSGKLPIVIPLIDYDKANKRPVWLQTELAKKAQAPALAKLLHSPSLWFFIDVVKIMIGKASMYRQNTTVESMKKTYFDERMWKGNKPTEQDWDIFLSYVSDLAELATSTTIELGDFNNASNWGVYKNRPVVLDLGFTEDTAQLYAR